MSNNSGKTLEKGFKWWVRYAIVPFVTAIIGTGGVVAITVALISKPTRTPDLTLTPYPTYTYFPTYTNIPTFTTEPVDFITPSVGGEETPTPQSALGKKPVPETGAYDLSSTPKPLSPTGGGPNDSPEQFLGRLFEQSDALLALSGIVIIILIMFYIYWKQRMR